MELTFRFIIEAAETEVELIQKTNNEMVFRVYSPRTTSTTKSTTRKTLNHKLIIDLWNQGVHVNEIAKQAGTTPGSIYQFAHRNGECQKRRSGKKSPSQLRANKTPSTKEPMKVVNKADYPRTGERLRQNEINALCKMWRDGQRNVTELARYFEVSRNTIYYQLKVNGCRSGK